MKTNIFTLSLSIIFLFGIFSCDSPSEQSSSQEEVSAPETGGAGQSGVTDEESQQDILRVALGSPDHTTLVVAVKAAGLANTLANAGPFTVFAPNNAAFDALPEGTVETLLKPENKTKLSRILQHHVTTSVYEKEKFMDGQSLWVVDGGNVVIKVEGDDVWVGGAKILGSVRASNGIVHVVDAIILPEG
jgi:uncharacterized surface protein with fasciclin (FAS1) repeats